MPADHSGSVADHGLCNYQRNRKLRRGICQDHLRTKCKQSIALAGQTCRDTHGRLYCNKTPAATAGHGAAFQCLEQYQIAAIL